MIRYRNNFIYNALEMPAYWLETARAKRRYERDWQVRKHRYGPSSKQYYLSVDTAASAPVNMAKPWAIYLHGGAWTFGSPEQFLPAARPFIEAGYRVVLPSYRRLTHQNFAGIWSDLQASLRHYHGEFGGAGPTVVAGMSGGGHLAASLAGNDPGWKELNWQAPTKVILCGSVLDLDTMPDSLGLRKLAGQRGTDQFNRANPAWWLKQKNTSPGRFLLVHGDADGMVAINQSHCYFEVLKKKKIPAELLIVKNGTHLDAGRWMYREDEVYLKIKEFLA